MTATATATEIVRTTEPHQPFSWSIPTCIHAAWHAGFTQQIPGAPFYGPHHQHQVASMALAHWNKWYPTTAVASPKWPKGRIGNFAPKLGSEDIQQLKILAETYLIPQAAAATFIMATFLRDHELPLGLRTPTQHIPAAYTTVHLPRKPTTIQLDRTPIDLTQL